MWDSVLSSCSWKTDEADGIVEIPDLVRGCVRVHLSPGAHKTDQSQGRERKKEYLLPIIPIRIHRQGREVGQSFARCPGAKSMLGLPAGFLGIWPALKAKVKGSDLGC